MITVRATRYAECPFSAAIELAERVLRERSEIVVSPAPHVAGAVHVTAKSTDDFTDTCRRHDALLIAWKPLHAWIFPRFHGALTVRPKNRGVWLRLEGSYEPPFGMAGRVFDAVVGRRIAKRTLSRLLDDLRIGVERQWTNERRGVVA